MKVVVIGHGAEGKSAQAYWAANGADVAIRDQKDGDGYLDGLDQFDLIVRSPGVHPSKIKSIKPVTSVTQEFLAKCPVPVIGVTGTKGKGTTCSLIVEILKAASHTVHLGGNIGRPALDFLADIKAGDKVVLELSSFQLMDVKQSPQTAVMLMISPDHLDVHTDMDEYIQAKANIFRYQTKNDVAVYFAPDERVSELVVISQGRHMPYFDPAGAHVKDGQVYYQDTLVMPVSEIGIIGEHNWQNVCAAITAVWDEIEGDVEAIRKAVSLFSGLPHRLKLVGEVGGARYYDDSIATTPESAIAAIQAFSEPKVVILGGSDKGAKWAELASAVQLGNVVKAILIGDTAQTMADALRAVGFTNYQTGLGTMEEIVESAGEAATPGSVVLLSPGCASFGMFKNYQDRGDQFATAVDRLEQT